MSIKQYGGVFGRNPTFNDVTIEGDLTTESGLTTSGGITTSGNIISSEEGISTPTADGITIERPTGSSSPTPAEIRMSSTTQASDWSTTDPWGRVSFYTKDTSGGGGKIHASMEIRAAHSSGGRSRLAFKTTSSSADDLDNALVIDPDQGSGRHVTVSDGNLVIGTSGNGIDFSATAGTGTSELLDDYEEGTWTPAFSGGDYSFTYNKQKGSYTKIGNRVFIDCVLYVHPSTAPSGSVDGDLEIINLPYTFNKQNDVEVVGGVAHFKQLFMSTVEVLAARLGDGGTSFKLYDTLATNYPELAYVQASDVAANTRIRIQFSYPTNG